LRGFPAVSTSIVNTYMYKITSYFNTYDIKAICNGSNGLPMMNSLGYGHEGDFNLCGLSRRGMLLETWYVLFLLEPVRNSLATP